MGEMYKRGRKNEMKKGVGKQKLSKVGGMLGKRVDALKSVCVYMCVCVCVCVCVCMFGEGAATLYKLLEYDLAP